MPNPITPRYLTALRLACLCARLDELPLDIAVDEFKKTFISAMLKERRGNQCAVAADLGVHRNTLSRQMQALGIEKRGKSWPATRNNRRLA